MKPLIYLEFRQFLNAVRNASRSPKRLIPLIIIVGLFGSSLLQNIVSVVSGQNKPMLPGYGLHLLPVDLMWSGVFLLIFLTSGIMVYSALKDGMLIFAPADIDFLFSAPIKRRSVLAIKLLRDYIKYAAISAITVAYLGTSIYGALNVSPYPSIFLSWIGVFFFTVFITNVTHTLNIATTFGIQRLRFATILVKSVLALAALLVVVSVIVAYIREGNALAGLIAATRSTVSRIVFAPAAWCTDLVLAPVTDASLENEGRSRLLWLFLLSAGSAAMLLARKENIYEPSLGISVRIAKMRAAMRTGGLTAARIEARRFQAGRSYAVSPIPPFGKGAAALLWKNLVTRIRALGWRLALLLLIPLGVATVRTVVVDADVLRFSPLIMPYLIFYVVIIVQHDLRAELRQANILKAMPISGLKMVAAQVVYEWTLILVFTGIIAASIWAFIPEADGDILSLATLGALSLGFLSVSAASIPALLYPASRDWVQEMISLAFTLFITGIAIVPAAVAATILLLVSVDLWIVATVVVALNAALSCCALAIGGVLFRRFDPTSE